MQPPVPPWIRPCPSHDALFYFGHGTATALRGASIDLVDTINVGLMANRAIVAIACWSAKTLGPIAVTSSGLAAYLGFDDKLLWLTGDPDLQFEPAICSGPNDLMQRSDMGTALVSMRTQLQNVVTHDHSGSGKSNPNSIIGSCQHTGIRSISRSMATPITTI